MSLPVELPPQCFADLDFDPRRWYDYLVWDPVDRSFARVVSAVLRAERSLSEQGSIDELFFWVRHVRNTALSESKLTLQIAADAVAHRALVGRYADFVKEVQNGLHPGLTSEDLRRLRYGYPVPALGSVFAAPLSRDPDAVPNRETEAEDVQNDHGLLSSDQWSGEDTGGGWGEIGQRDDAWCGHDGGHWGW